MQHAPESVALLALGKRASHDDGALGSVAFWSEEQRDDSAFFVAALLVDCTGAHPCFVYDKHTLRKAWESRPDARNGFVEEPVAHPGTAALRKQGK